MRRPLQPAIRRIAIVEHHLRMAARVGPGLRSAIIESEISARREWHNVIQAAPALSLAAIIELVRRRHSIRNGVFRLETFPQRPRLGFLHNPTAPLRVRGLCIWRETKGGGKGCKKGGKKGLGLSGKRRYVKKTGSTIAEPEIYRANNSADGCRMAGVADIIICPGRVVYFGVVEAVELECVPRYKIGGLIRPHFPLREKRFGDVIPPFIRSTSLLTSPLS